MNGEMPDMVLTQTSTVIRRLSYTRAEAIAVLVDAGDDAAALGLLTNREIGDRIIAVSKADTEGGEYTGLYSALCAAAGDPEETIDNDDWELTDVYGEDAGPLRLFGRDIMAGDVVVRPGLYDGTNVRTSESYWVREVLGGDQYIDLCVLNMRTGARSMLPVKPGLTYEVTERATAAPKLWVPINDYPGDQRYDSVPGAHDKSFWGEIGTTSDDRWSWTIMGRNDKGQQWDEAGGVVGSEAEAKAAVENWRPTR